MIDLTKDLFVHLSMSAKALKVERVQQQLVQKAPILSKLEKTFNFKLTSFDIVIQTVALIMAKNQKCQERIIKT